jgi:Uma2 family endonuclease
VTTRTTAVVAAVEHLPEGAMLVIPEATWEEYEQLLDTIAARPGMRVTYDRGRLEVMSPSPEHEEFKELVLQLARVLADERGTPLETRGATTWKRRSSRQGAEPDTCFYVGHASRIIGKPRIDLEVDPPPDVVVEIDVTNESLSKFPVYAALGVPEVWRYDGTAVQFFGLVQAGYHGRRAGQTAALRAFRLQLRSR